MLCPICNSKYDSHDHAKHKLTDCSHYICGKCWNAHPLNATVTCPTCGKRQQKSQPPESRSLKSGTKVEQRGSDLDESSDDEEDDPFDKNSITEINQSDVLCAAHFKGYEGYCLTCNILICLDCIFEKHKTHDFVPLEKAKERISNELGKKQLELEGNREECLQRLSTVKSFQEDLTSSYEKKVVEIRTVMNEIRRYLMIREQKLEEKVKEDFQRCREENSALVSKAEKDLHKIDSMISTIKHHTSRNSIMFLGSIGSILRRIQVSLREHSVHH